MVFDVPLSLRQYFSQSKRKIVLSKDEDLLEEKCLTLVLKGNT